MSPYGSVVRAPGIRHWAAAALPYRLARAMAPLSLILLAHDRTGGFAAGGVLIGALVIPEVLVAPWVVRRIPLSLGMLGYGAAMVALTLVPLRSAGGLVLAAVCAAAAGTCAAGAAGLSRAVLTAIVAPADRTAALSADGGLGAALYAVGPVLVALATPAGPAAPVLTIAALGVVSAVAVHRRRSLWDTVTEGASPVLDVVRRVWPTLVAGLSFMAFTSALETVLPARLAAEGHATKAGLLLGLFAGVGILGGLLYGMVRSRTALAVQATVCTLGMCLLLVPVALTESVPLLVVTLAAGGLAGPPALVARAGHLHRTVAADDRPAAFALLSSAYGVGTGVAALGAGAAVDSLGPSTTWALVTAATAALTLIAFVASGRPAPTADHDDAARRELPVS